jgi:hypothetical protein
MPLTLIATRCSWKAHPPLLFTHLATLSVHKVNCLAGLTISTMETGTNEWKEKYRVLQESYELLEARVVALSGREYEMADNKITKHYRAIRDNMDAWIDDVQSEEHKHFKSTYQKNLQRMGEGRMLDKLGLDSGSIRRGWAETLGSLKTCVYVVLAKVISETLRGLFKRPYPLGITEAQQDLFEVSKRATSSSSQPRGESICLSLQFLRALCSILNSRASETFSLFVEPS